MAPTQLQAEAPQQGHRPLGGRQAAASSARCRPGGVQVIVSLAAVAAFALIGWPTLIATTGVWGFVKFWLVPWLGYHFWMSTFTVVHHTAPHIPFKAEDEWNAAKAQLSGTVHCDYPRWYASQRARQPQGRAVAAVQGPADPCSASTELGAHGAHRLRAAPGPV